MVRAGRVEKFVDYSMPILINKRSSTQLEKKLQMEQERTQVVQFFLQ